MESREFTGRTIEEALTAATVELGVTSDNINYEVIEKGSSGFLGLGSKEAVIKVSIKSDDNDEAVLENEETIEEKVESVEASDSDDTVSDVLESNETAEVTESIDEDSVKAIASEFLSSVFDAMNLEVTLDMKFEEDGKSMIIDMSGPEMGIIIGKRGATLDSLQYLTNLAVNKKINSYVRIKMDTEDYRRRRKATLENLAKNVAYKVKRTKRSVSLEAMNPYERRIIHYALQNDSYVTTYSEGEEPYRHVVVALK